jgi:FkbM family methyltransferase
MDQAMRYWFRRRSPAPDPGPPVEDYLVQFIRCRLPDGADYLVPEASQHRPACASLLKGKMFEPRTHKLVALAQQVLPGHIVHAGTFYGDMLPSFARICGPDRLVYGFEPLLENYVLARGTVDANGLRNVVLFGAALGDGVRACRMSNRIGSDPERHAGGASHIVADSAISAAMLALDGLRLRDLSVVHLDVEGTELAAMEGARETLTRSRPLLLVEDQKAACGDFLAAQGYRWLGRIPALNVWCPDDRSDLSGAVLGAGILTRTD